MPAVMFMTLERQLWIRRVFQHCKAPVGRNNRKQLDGEEVQVMCCALWQYAGSGFYFTNGLTRLEIGCVPLPIARH